MKPLWWCICGCFLLAVLGPTAHAAKGKESPPKVPSGWSNKGAMKPIEGPAEDDAAVPPRTVRDELDAKTPGQRLKNRNDRLSAHLSFGGYHLSTVGQDMLWLGDDERVPTNRDIDVLRARATMSYDRIAGTEFAFHLDTAYRGQLNGSRPNDYRVNALYAAYGLRDFRPGASSWGLMLGRVVIPEAGYAHADGAAVRFRLLDELHLGAFGGLSGNPYRYSWSAYRLEKEGEQNTPAKIQEFSAEYFTSGAYLAMRYRELAVDVAAVIWGATTGGAGIDRVAVYADAAWSPVRTLNIFLTAFLDIVPGGRPIQNLELITTWRPIKPIYVRLSLARFSTLQYDLSAPISFTVDPNGNRVSVDDPENGPVAIDEEGVDIITFDQQLFVATYNAVNLRSGYRFDLGVEPYLSLEVQVREPEPTAVQFAAVRALPAIGVLYRNARVLDAKFSARGVFDSQTQTRGVLAAGIGRRFFGFEAQVDARVFVGGTFAADGGGALTYTLAVDGLPGRLLFRLSGRYFREDIALRRPVDPDEDILPDDRDPALDILPVQESLMVFGGVDWRW